MKTLLLLASLLAACSSVSTSYDFDPKADFARLKRYTWLKPATTAPAPRNPFARQRIEHAVDTELDKRGYASGGEADFLVAAHTGSQQRVRVTDYGYGYGYWGGGRIDVYQYEEGTLILDIIDARSKKLMWRGTATAAVMPNPSPEETSKLINEAVSKLMKDFPPPR